MKRLLIFGYGYSARALAQVLRAEGWEVRGTTRDGDGAIKWPGTDMTEHLDWASHLLISIAPRGEGDPVLNAYGEALRTAQFRLGRLPVDHSGLWRS